MSTKSTGRRRHRPLLLAAIVVVAATLVSAAGKWVSPRTTPAMLPGLATPTEYGEIADSPSDPLWIGGDVPGRSTRWEPMARAALRDLHHLTYAPPTFGGPVAGAGLQWGLTWPRDAAFTVVAMAETGHAPEALTALAFLQDVQQDGGGFAARYQLNGRSPLDPRTAQADGSGWVLWALESVSVAASRETEVVLLRRFRPLLDRATNYAARQTEGPHGLPGPSSDYWERREGELTLGTAAPLLIGLRSAARMYTALGEGDHARSADEAATALEDGIIESFGPGGYQRYGDHGGVDASVAFLCPPFVKFADTAGITKALNEYQRTARRLSGGLAPGAGWRDDGISWTPETALVALAAAGTGDRVTAERWLDWLDAQRVSWGSLPEKVRPDGLPAGPAPLAWTSSIVVMTLESLSSTGTASPALSSDSVISSIAEIDRLMSIT